MDLEQMLYEVIDCYGKNEGYAIPTISWSEENMVSRYGEYQFWRNHIFVSNLLQSDAISIKAIKSVIFHEYTHQMFTEHNKDFNSRMELFEGYNACQKELEKYFERLKEFPIGKIQNMPLDKEKEIIFCKLPYNPEDIDSYWKHYLYYNHYITGFLSGDIPAQYCKKLVKQIVWLVESSKTMYVVGWGKNVQLYPTIQKADLREYGLDVIEYQFKYKQKDGKTILPCNVFEALFEEEYPITLTRHGICNANEIDAGIVNEVVDIINTYSADFIEYGIIDTAMDCIPGIETDDVSELIAKAKKAGARDRVFLIMNKAVNIEQSYRTYLHRGMAFYDCSIFDKALEDLEKALKYDYCSNEQMSKEDVKKIIQKIKGAATAI